jgi:hypothetical protein
MNHSHDGNIHDVFLQDPGIDALWFHRITVEKKISSWEIVQDYDYGDKGRCLSSDINDDKGWEDYMWESRKCENTIQVGFSSYQWFWRVQLYCNNDSLYSLATNDPVDVGIDFGCSFSLNTTADGCDCSGQEPCTITMPKVLPESSDSSCFDSPSTTLSNAGHDGLWMNYIKLEKREVGDSPCWKTVDAWGGSNEYDNDKGLCFSSDLGDWKGWPIFETDDWHCMESSDSFREPNQRCFDTFRFDTNRFWCN